MDASFVYLESPTSHVHVGGMLDFEGPAPAMAEIVEHIRGRLALVPRFCQKLAFTPLEMGRPVWVDDPAFDLDYHMRHVSLSTPGSAPQLQAQCARIFSQPLDRSKPLWEIWFVDGLERDRFALITKTHHCVMDVVSIANLYTVLFDHAAAPTAIAAAERWQRRGAPAHRAPVGASLRATPRAGDVLAGQAAARRKTPTRALRATRDTFGEIGAVVAALRDPAPATPLNVDIGSSRRYIGVPGRLDDFKFVNRAFGATINDVVLSVTTGALREFLLSRGVRVDGLVLHALVPTSVRTADEHGSFHDKVAETRVPLPVHIEDPLVRLRHICAVMQAGKDFKETRGLKFLLDTQRFTPPRILAIPARLIFTTRLFNLVVTNIAGPELPLYALGRRMERMFPVVLLPRRHALVVGIVSYEDRMDFGLLADHDALPDLDVIGRAITSELYRLVSIAHDAESNARVRLATGRDASLID
ncbi:MAG TPA: wax ester/triacylglycerol synthase family O-acyltransferase [Solirubrobacteraceae bacterium]|nr:wax ester/triacylglycerol synthase family O-acyltransferase [Solirubrobacteraceae bacterium]